MKAKKVIITALGSTDVIKISQFDVPEPKDNEVIVKVVYAGLAYADIMLRNINISGLPKPPFTPGADFTGIVEKTGKNVSQFKPGNRVAGILMNDLGGQTQYACIDEKKIFHVPDAIPLDKCVCLLINYLTAFKMFQEYEKKSKTIPRGILIHGGSGGVGSALIQIAVAKGINVFSTASSRNIAYVKSLGAKAIDYTHQDFENKIRDSYQGTIDAVFDSIGGDYLKRSISILNKGGYYIAYGFQKSITSGGMFKSIIGFMIKKLITFSKTLMVFQLNSYKDDFKTDLEEIFKLYTDKKIDPTISNIIPIENAIFAHEKLERGQRTGKIIIKANDEN